MTTKKWTAEEEEYLIRNYQKLSDKEIGEKLGRSVPAVINRRIKLGLEKNSKEKHVLYCKNCSTKIIVNNSRKDAIFCSRKCKGDYTKKNSGSIRKCIVCGKDFYAAGNPANREICSRECFYEYRKTGKTIQCANCGKEVYKPKNIIKRSSNFFCSPECANIFQKGEMIQIKCKICEKIFEVHPSTLKHSKIRKQKIQYCSIECRNNDPDKTDMLIHLNQKQNKNKKRNKLEQAGIDLLEKLNIEFEEQKLINDKISVDVYIPACNIIIEWWGDYWHGHPSKIKNSKPDSRQKKRMALDISQKKYFEKCGFNFISFWEHEVLKNPEKVMKKLQEMVDLAIRG